MATLLDDHGVNVNVRDHEGRTVLHYEFQGAQLSMTCDQSITWRLEHEVDPNIVDNDGHTALFLLIAKPDRTPKDIAPLVRLLCASGARLSAADADAINHEDRCRSLNRWVRELEVSIDLWTTQDDHGGRTLTHIGGRMLRSRIHRAEGAVRQDQAPDSTLSLDPGLGDLAR